MSFLSISTWSLHRNLGPLHWTRWDEQKQTQVTIIDPQPETISLLELPAELAVKGFGAIEIGHFHFRDTSEVYLHQLKAAIHNAGLCFYTLLIDYGDISSEDEVRRLADITWIKGWIDIAAIVGAERVRIIAGQAESTNQAALKLSIEALQQLCEYADTCGVRVVTENFQPLTSTADNCLALLAACGEQLGLISDFGNFTGDYKFSELKKIISKSESIHAKAITDGDGHPDAEEFQVCMNLVKRLSYDGPIVIIYDGPHDMWDGIERVKQLVIPYL
ncbi:sugar phosphate isomerase/epimerase [Paenibacillus psychroresistens]|uniref:Sugar phosphate isomerase/epimerase n=1 Tax=Paenibacillus psychroresistens TaxID=1778678 RepID=A0A6B8RW36_9BACL|nr:TIM barrel protein [Paenibacillus psychroresistens]QGQ99426.1 sugar phosphate isomerase/epimerase [Paenibacillus psychroresistens]